ncbi:MAG: arylesterase [Flavobacteriales bacterium TMED235]|nr:MAG: arylesterase [Flavobacteriales bacterium TMED235]
MSIIFNYNKTYLVLFFLFIYSFTNATEKLENFRLIIIGDSLIQGYGLPKDKGFVNQLQKKILEKKDNILLINGGVSGDTTAGGLSRIDWSITNDINAVAISLGANDMLRGIPPSFSKENLSKIIMKVKENNLPILLIGIKSIENYGTKYKNEFDSMFSNLADEFELFLYPDLMAPILNEEKDLSHYLQEDMLHPNEKGVEIIVQEILPTITNFIDSFNNKN